MSGLALLSSGRILALLLVGFAVLAEADGRRSRPGSHSGTLDSLGSEALSVSDHSQAPFSPRPRQAEWGFAVFGHGIGFSGLLTATAPTPGTPPEVYLAGTSNASRNNYWHALRYSSDTGLYEDVFVSEIFANGIVRLALADMVGDERLEIVVVFDSGDVILYDQHSKHKLPGYSLPGYSFLEPIRTVEIHDIEGDRRPELVVGSDESLMVYALDGTLPWKAATRPTSPPQGSSIAIGQMDADRSLEIAGRRASSSMSPPAASSGSCREGLGPDRWDWPGRWKPWTSMGTASKN